MPSLVGKTIRRVDYGVVEFTDDTVLVFTDGLNVENMIGEEDWADARLLTLPEWEEVERQKAEEEAAAKAARDARQALIAAKKAELPPEEFRAWYDEHYSVSALSKTLREVWSVDLEERLEGTSPLLDLMKKD